jgi:AraC family transcriptional regulator of adaptative response/methylated-DNA-[protein]-cysteine methyltransferase
MSPHADSSVTTVQWTRTASALGTVHLAATPRGVCRIALDTTDDAFTAALTTTFPHATVVRDDAALTGVATEVARRADGAEPRLDVALHLVGSDFQQRVWSALNTIPRGSVRTYAEVADEVGAPRAARAVGRACGTNPVSIIVPCHRVVPATGGIGNYGWGPTRKRTLLAREGALV